MFARQFNGQYQKLFYIFLMILILISLSQKNSYSEEIKLKSNKIMTYQSIFAMDVDGITLEIDGGLFFVAWVELDIQTAKKISHGQYPDLLLSTPKILNHQHSKIEEPARKLSINQKEKSPEDLRLQSNTILEKKELEIPFAHTIEKGTLKTSSVITDTSDLDLLFNDEGVIWITDAEEFMSLQKSNRFRWVSVSEKKEIISNYKKLRFLGFRVWEVILRYQGDKISECIISLYNRGDAGLMGLSEFEKMTEQVQNKISVWTQQKPIHFQDRHRTGGIKIFACAWICKSHRIDCEWSISKNVQRAEFLRLRISPVNHASQTVTTIVMPEDTRPKNISFYDLKQHVHQAKNGDIFISGVPMVDQGNKGYCAVAVAERVLRYYGRNIDQHELAQLAMTSSSLGTDPDAMLEALRKIGRRMEISIRKHKDFNAKDFNQLLSRYNKAARKQKMPQIYLGRELYHISDIYKRMDYGILKKLCLEKVVEKNSFEKSIKQYINVGVPLAWGVVIGIVEEKPKVISVGGHMRLIIGYNELASEIIYTDTWGSGHEQKRMAL
ncbi:MAG: C39 family peptidase, partial [Chlamydiota bacterium]|nr:C39 family peptidase [Chlamydiota bacterium]